MRGNELPKSPHQTALNGRPRAGEVEGGVWIRTKEMCQCFHYGRPKMDGPELLKGKKGARGKFEVGIVSMLQTALNGRPGAMQFLREVCRLGGGRGEGCPLQTAQMDGLER